MRKLIIVVMMVLFLVPIYVNSVFAEDENKTFNFNLSVDGENTREVKKGDIITVVLKLQRKDTELPYTMYAMQDEIRYDSSFFEMVEGSAILNTGIVTTDIAMVDRYREFYMNYLSMSGGTQWNSDMLVGSFQLKVTGEAGVTKITNQDYLVSMKDGSKSYTCDSDDVTVILSSDCVVKFMSNGGSETPDQTVQYGEKIVCPEKPEREGFLFEGWYIDIYHTKEWNFEEDTVQGNMTLYAKWTVETTQEVTPETEDQKGGSTWCYLMIIVILLLLWKMYRHNKKKK